MGRWFSNNPDIRSGKWKLLVASVLVAVLIGLSCGLCESSMRRVCMTITSAIASSLSRTEEKTNAPRNNIRTGIMSRATTLSTTITSKTSSKDCGDMSRKKFATSTVANMGTKTYGPTIMPVCSTYNSTIKSLSNSNKALLLTLAQHLQNYGRMASAQLASLTSTVRPILPGTSLKKSPARTPWRRTCAPMNTESLIGLDLLTLRCH